MTFLRRAQSERRLVREARGARRADLASRQPRRRRSSARLLRPRRGEVRAATSSSCATAPAFASGRSARRTSRGCSRPSSASEPDGGYRRFLGHEKELSVDELASLTEVDHHDHEAIAASDPETGQGVGSRGACRARSGRTSPRRRCTVVDDWQGRGIGELLLSRLAERARGGRRPRVHATLLADRPRDARSSVRLGALRGRAVGTVLEIDVALPLGQRHRRRGAPRRRARGSHHRLSAPGADSPGYAPRRAPCADVADRLSPDRVGHDNFASHSDCRCAMWSRPRPPAPARRTGQERQAPRSTPTDRVGRRLPRPPRRRARRRGSSSPAWTASAWSTVTTLRRATQFDAADAERPGARARTEAGAWRVYVVRCATPDSEHWRIDVVEAAALEGLRRRRRRARVRGRRRTPALRIRSSAAAPTAGTRGSAATCSTCPARRTGWSTRLRDERRRARLATGAASSLAGRREGSGTQRGARL